MTTPEFEPPGEIQVGHYEDAAGRQFNPFHGTAKEHLDWCVYRAMEYANAGDMPNAWASFARDVTKHEGTAHIATHEFFAMAMFSGVMDRTPEQFRKFISGWAVAS